MSQSCGFRTPYGSQRVNGSQSLMKSSRDHFCNIVSLIWEQLSCNEMLLVRCEILERFLNTMTTDDNISCGNRNNFAQQIQMQLSQQSKRFSGVFFVFLESTSNFEYFEKNEGLIA